jgi:putative membrane protein
VTRGWLAIYLLVLGWSMYHPADLFTWALEVFPALLGLAVLLLTRHRFALTPLAYWLVLAHCIILMVGGHYTYAGVPLFDRLGELFGWTRNNYDKLGHFAQGFVPALLAREVLVRKAVVNGRDWLNFLVVCFCLALSAGYELLEWGVAVWTGTAADAFLGTQGYLWDTQSDMGWALTGAVLSLLLLARVHDAQLARLRGYPAGA